MKTILEKNKFQRLINDVKFKIIRSRTSSLRGRLQIILNILNALIISKLGFLTICSTAYEIL